MRKDDMPDENPLAAKTAALSALFRMLAWQFAYPSTQQARACTSLEYLAACRELVRKAGIEDVSLEDSFTRFEKAARLEEDRRASLLRIEHTRLFITPPPLVRRDWAWWVKRNRTLVSKKAGERCAVEQVYREQGLANRPGATDPPDHLVSELDFVSFATSEEAGSWAEDDAAGARAWRQLREDFLKHHMEELALGVALEVERASDDPFLLCYAALLRAVVVSAGEGQL